MSHAPCCFCGLQDSAHSWGRHGDETGISIGDWKEEEAEKEVDFWNSALVFWQLLKGHKKGSGLTLGEHQDLQSTFLFGNDVRNSSEFLPVFGGVEAAAWSKEGIGSSKSSSSGYFSHALSSHTAAPSLPFWSSNRQYFQHRQCLAFLSLLGAA